MDVDATYALMVDPASDLDEAAVAAVDLLVWVADSPYKSHVFTMGSGGSRWRRSLSTRELAESCKHHIFRALDRLAELEETCAKPT